MRMVAARAAGDSRYSTTAEESVIAPPKPSIVWNRPRRIHDDRRDGRLPAS